ncbi:MFS transporter [Aspergillus chevalieri]|uniref:Major facilitator superfamily (MFS) profile domain-containing protein n=1 Tax=Aspergillus chevalieri TaxID=182096 RepID=A0A7R7ZRF3_ASPCH|nr:uncharacterized protein ACHE_60143S [Aspergillus chevalieri]BCR90257.1 hypothetical protein ACHE_60143S [Aspergillus chevalieri]
MVATWLTPGKGKKRPAMLYWRAHKNYILFVVAFAVFTDMFLYGMIVPVAPTALQNRVGLDADQQQQWTSILLALYGASLLATSPLTGYLADRIQSRQWPLLFGLVALAISTALLCIGTSLGLWIAGRILQGASTAVVWTAGLALLADTMDSQTLGQSMGYVGMAMTLGLMCGPLIGGVLYQKGGYYSVYGLAFGLIGVDILARVVMIERKDAIPWFKAEEVSLSEDQGQERVSAEKPPSNNIAPRSIAPTPEPEATTQAAAAPPPPPTPSARRFGRLRTLLNSSRLMVSIWTYLIVSLAVTSFDSVLPLFVEETFLWKQTAQGLIFIAISVPSFLDPVVGWIVDKWPLAGRFVCSGALFASVPILVCLRFVDENTIGDKVLLCALLALAGLCVACLMPPVMVEVSCVVNEKEAAAPNVFGEGGAMALAYGVLNSAWAAGSIIGPFFAGFIRDDAGWGTMAWALSILTGVTGVPVLMFLGGFIGKKRVKKASNEQEQEWEQEQEQA